MFQCNTCSSTFSRKDNLKHHLEQKHSGNKKLFSCDDCSRVFTENSSLKRHLKIQHNVESENKKFKPSITSEPMPSTSKQSEMIMNDKPSTSRQFQIEKETNPTDPKSCSVCNVTLSSVRALHAHLKSIKHKNNSIQKYMDDEDIDIINSAFKSRIVSYRVKDNVIHIIIENFLSGIKSKVTKLLELQRDSHICIKVNMELYALYSRIDNKGR